VTARRAGIGASAVGMVVVVAGSFLPWVRTGRRARASFDLVGVADRLGVVRSGVVTVVAHAWVLVPLLVAVALAATALGAARVAAVLAVVTGSATLLLAWTVLGSPLSIAPGLPVSTAGGMMAIVGGVLLGWSAWAGPGRKAG
jgi:hypothetical protein